jgi:hypothetical protein
MSGFGDERALLLYSEGPFCARKRPRRRHIVIDPPVIKVAPLLVRLRSVLPGNGREVGSLPGPVDFGKAGGVVKELLTTPK